jgi:hypothetical protein
LPIIATTAYWDGFIVGLSVIETDVLPLIFEGAI